MKKTLLLTSIVCLSSSAFASNLEVQFNGAIAASACEPVLIEGGAASLTNSIDLGTYSVADATTTTPAAIGTPVVFSIGQKDAAECKTVTNVDVRVAGIADSSNRTVLKNVNTGIPNIGVLLKDGADKTVLNTTMNYTDPTNVDYSAQLFNIDGSAPNTGVITGVVDYTIAYK
ncbi:TPA: fimbrial protein [Photobacterium damselae]